MRPEPARIRVRYDNTARTWHAVKLDRQDQVLDRSPPGDEVEAEGYANNFRKYGAWEKS